MNNIKTKLALWMVEKALLLSPLEVEGLIVVISKQLAARERAAKKAATKTDA
jgi:hypothetical protein